MNVSITSPPEASQASEPTPVSRGQIADTSAALRAIIFKEVRPNLPYALGVVGILGLIAMIPSITNTLRPVPLPPSRENILSSPDFLGLLYFVAAVVGFLMGAVQGRTSRTPDAWAFMIHRPLSTGNLFLGKLLSAAILYGVAAGIPMVALLMYAGLSNSYPYHWRFDLPVVTAFLGGFLFSVAGLLVMERKAFILGSATTPLLTMAVAVVAAGLAPSFASAVAILVLVGIAIALAAWGSQASDGYQRRAPVVAQVALSVILLIGFTVLLAVPSQIFKQQCRTVTPSPPAAFGIQLIMSVSGGDRPGWQSGRPMTTTTTSYLFLPDGTLGRKLEETKTGLPSGIAEFSERYVRDDSPGTDLDLPTVKKGVEQVAERMGIFRLPPPAPAYTDVESKNDAFSGNENDPEVWYFIRVAGVIRGYDRRTGTSLGTIGAEGWVPPTGSAVPFRSWNGDGQIFVGPRGLYEVSISKRTSVLRLEVPAGEKVEGWCRVRGEAGAGGGPGESFLAALTATHIYIGNENGAAPVLVLPTGTRTLSGRNYSITRFTAAKRWGVVGFGEAKATQIRGPSTFQIFDDAGKMIAEKWVPQAQFTEPAPVSVQETTQDTALSNYASGLFDAISNPPAMWAASALISSSMFTNQPGGRGRFFDPQFDSWYLAPAVQVLLVSALFALLLGRVFAVRGKWVWVAFALICGPTVVLLMMATHHVQRTTACPSCGKSRYLFSRTCPNCGAKFPPAPPNGTEIFTA